MAASSSNRSLLARCSARTTGMARISGSSRAAALNSASQRTSDGLGRGAM